MQEAAVPTRIITSYNIMYATLCSVYNVYCTICSTTLIIQKQFETNLYAHNKYVLLKTNSTNFTGMM